LRPIRGNRRGITFAFAVLIIFIVLFLAGVAYLLPPAGNNSRHTYFEGLNFSLPTNNTWRVGVPIRSDGNLHLSILSSETVQLYVRNGDTYFLDRKVSGNQQFVLPVRTSMGVLEVGVRNQGRSSISINQFTCFWTP
jgi:hypothetical protein